MDKEGLVESSSFQNVNLSIASLQERGSGKETVRVFLSEGSSFFMPLPLPDTWQRGSLLGEADLALLREEDSFVRGREWVVSCLVRREVLLAGLRGGSGAGSGDTWGSGGVV